MDSRGNNPEAFEKLLKTLDDKLQLGLLNYVRGVSSYHIEEDVLYLESDDEQTLDYLSKEPVRQQLELLAQDAIGVKEVVIRSSQTTS